MQETSPEQTIGKPPLGPAGLLPAVELLQGEVGHAFTAAVLVAGDRGDERLRLSVGQAGLSTWFDLSSLTKALCTSVLAMRLHEQGRLLLDEEALPGVTVAQLLSHTSGLPAWLPLHSLARIDPRTGQGPEGRTAREAIAAAAAAAPRGPAGQRAVYSDLGFILLGRLIEERGRARLDRQFSPIAAAIGADLGFRPIGESPPAPADDELGLGMRHAPTRKESPEREPLCGVVHDDNARAMGGVAGHAGLFGTAAGVSLLAQALLHTYVDRPTPLRRALGLSPQTVRRFWQRAEIAGSPWGLGWDHPNPHEPGEKSGSAAGALWSRDGVGHLGFTGCSLWIDPDPKACRWVVFLANRVDMPDPDRAREAQVRMKALRPRLHDALHLAFAETRGQSGADS